jgi:hypothetical protein
MKGIRIEIKWAIIFFLTALAWMLLEKLVGLHDQHIEKHAIYTNIFAVPAIAVYVFALLDKRKNFFSGIMSYKQGLISGLIITLIVTLLNPLSQYLISNFITPNYFANAISYTVETGKMTQEMAENYFSTKSYILQGFIGTPIMGIITTAIVALFVKRNHM